MAEAESRQGEPLSRLQRQLRRLAQLICRVFYERVELGGYEAELELAELIWEQIESGELELPEHFAEGPEGDFTAEIAAYFEDVALEGSDLATAE